MALAVGYLAAPVVVTPTSRAKQQATAEYRGSCGK